LFLILFFCGGASIFLSEVYADSNSDIYTIAASPAEIIIPNNIIIIRRSTTSNPVKLKNHNIPVETIQKEIRRDGSSLVARLYPQDFLWSIDVYINSYNSSVISGHPELWDFQGMSDKELNKVTKEINPDTFINNLHFPPDSIVKYGRCSIAVLASQPFLEFTVNVTRSGDTETFIEYFTMHNGTKVSFVLHELQNTNKQSGYSALLSIIDNVVFAKQKPYSPFWMLRIAGILPVGTLVTVLSFAIFFTLIIFVTLWRQNRFEINRALNLSKTDSQVVSETAILFEGINYDTEFYCKARREYLDKKRGAISKNKLKKKLKKIDENLATSHGKKQLINQLERFTFLQMLGELSAINDSAGVKNGKTNINRNGEELPTFISESNFFSYFGLVLGFLLILLALTPNYELRTSAIILLVGYSISYFSAVSTKQMKVTKWTRILLGILFMLALIITINRFLIS
jgi:hypothetical protein